MNMEIYSLTVGSAYKKAEIPRDTKHFSDTLLLRRIKEVKQYLHIFKKPFRFLYSLMFIKQHQILEYTERELVPDFSSAVLLHKIVCS